MNRQQIQHEIAERAEWWFTHIESGDASADEIAEFERWLDQDDSHQLAFCRTVELCQKLTEIPQLASLEPSVKTHPAGRRFNWFKPVFSGSAIGWAGAFAVVIMAIAVLSVFETGPNPPATLEYATKTGEVRTIGLPDGSNVTLAARSEIGVVYSDAERHVKLISGEACFSVMADAQKPFVVNSADTKVTVLGTQFNVHSGPSAITVSVLQGRVEVSKPIATNTDDIRSTKPVLLDSGQQVISIRQGKLLATTNLRASEFASWRNGQLVYDDHTLKRVIADANRYSKRSIIITSETIENLPVTAAFGTHQVEKMIEGLAHLLPIKVIDKESGEILISPDFDRLK